MAEPPERVEGPWMIYVCLECGDICQLSSGSEHGFVGTCHACEVGQMELEPVEVISVAANKFQIGAAAWQGEQEVADLKARLATALHRAEEEKQRREQVDQNRLALWKGEHAQRNRAIAAEARAAKAEAAIREIAGDLAEACLHHQQGKWSPEAHRDGLERIEDKARAALTDSEGEE